MPSENPEAEMWMGAHGSAPSTVRINGEERTLLELIEQRGESILGKGTHGRFGARLPFLMKVLAAEKPLSIQVHPSSKQAKEGYERENRAHVELASRRRNYKDPYHKPELICALGKFEALCGFRDNESISARSGVLGASLTKLILESRKDALEYLLTLEGSAREEQLSKCLKRCREREGEDVIGQDCAWAARLASQYPDDIGVVVSLMLNRVELKAHEAIYLPAGVLHAYLEGVGVEIMACSDNVLRGGLTPKHIDIGELLRVTGFAPYCPPIVEPTVDGCEYIYRTEAVEFQLSRLELSKRMSVQVRGPEILLCLEGAITASDASGTTEMKTGDSIFVESSDESYTLEGNGRVYRATVPGEK